MLTQVTCNNCKQLIKADEKYFGKTVKCPHCKAHLKIPDPRTQGAQVADPLVGKQLAHYQIVELVGQGAMGKVYRARNIKLDKTCALKVLPEHFAKQDQDRIARFIREARTEANIDHPNVIPVWNLDHEGDTYFIEMQFIEGAGLDALVQEHGRMEPKEAARIIRDAACGLGAAHAKRVVHRDIKPANIMLTFDEQVKIADFGLARLGEGTTHFTLSGMIVGTPLYMSPEQAEGRKADWRSDIYSLGGVFYHLLTGRPPYTADNLHALLGMHTNAPVPDVRAVAPDVPEVLSAIIMRMMAKKPEERYQSCAEIADDLNSFLTSIATSQAAVKFSDSTLAKMAELRGRRVAGLAGDRGRRRSLAPILFGVIPTLIVVGVLAFVFVSKWKKQMGEKKGVPTEVTEKGKKETADKRRLTQMEEKGTGEEEGKKKPSVQSAKSVKSADIPSAESVPSEDKPEEKKEEPTANPPAGGKEKQEVSHRDTETTEKPDQIQNPKSKIQNGEKPSVPSVSPVVKPLEPQGKPLGGLGVLAVKPIDLVSFLDAIKPVDERIENYDYAAARGRANLLKAKYPDLIETKLANLDRIEALRKRCFDRINTSAVKLAMGDISTRYRLWGEIQKADEKGITAKVLKKWGDLNRDEIAEFYRKACDPQSAEDRIGIACFLMEGQADEKRLESAVDSLGKAAGLGGDVQPLLAYIETLKQARREYAEAEARGKALEGVSHPRDTESTERKLEGKPEETPEEKPSVSSVPPVVKSYDDVYVTTAATGEKIPHPLSRKTETIRVSGKTIKVPEGMVYVPEGPFLMGEGTAPPEGPQHEVYLDAYFIGKYEVTNAEWKAFVDANGFTPPQYWAGGKIPEGKENHPVVHVSWEDAQKYCEWVSSGIPRDAGQVRLPTEAQWEKAASWNFRKREKLQYPWGSQWDPRLCNWQGTWVAKYGLKFNPNEGVPSDQWTAFMKSDKWTKEIAPAGGPTMGVGSFPKGKSPYGCYDVAGNAYEWCRDWFKSDYYLLKDAKRNPQGPSEEQAEEVDIRGVKKKARVLRGGAWIFNARYCRCADRSRHDPSYRYDFFGFRVVCEVGMSR